MKNFSKLSRSQGQIINIKYEKNRNKSAILNFFQPLLNWSLVTCITNLGSIHEKLFKLRRPQVKVNANADDAELQVQ